MSAGPDVFLYITTGEDDPDDVSFEGSLRVVLDESERGTFSFTGSFTQLDLPEGFTTPDEVSNGSGGGGSSDGNQQQNQQPYVEKTVPTAVCMWDRP